MAERSFYWADETVGDGILSPYSNDEFSDIWRKLFMRNRNTQGYIEGYLNELQVTNPVGDVIRVATGAALVDGKFYENDAAIENSIASPTMATRHDRIVLRKSFSAQTTRVVTLVGEEGNAVPSITQSDGVTWEIPLATIVITTAGVITINDERIICRTPLAPSLSGAIIKIDEIIADGTSAVIDFTSIPSTYSHLLIYGTGRMTGAVLEALLQMRFNNDSGANYQIQNMRGENANNNATGTTGQTQSGIGRLPGATATAGYAAAIKLLVPNYSNATLFKQFFSTLTHMPNNTLANFEITNTGGQWDDTSTINRITLLSTTGGAGNFISGSIYSLYGVV
jgi:hypothetical protein